MDVTKKNRSAFSTSLFIYLPTYFLLMASNLFVPPSLHRVSLLQPAGMADGSNLVGYELLCC